MLIFQYLNDWFSNSEKEENSHLCMISCSVIMCGLVACSASSIADESCLESVLVKQNLRSSRLTGMLRCLYLVQPPPGYPLAHPGQVEGPEETKL